MKLDIGRMINGSIELIKNNPLILVPQILAGLLTVVMSMLLADSLFDSSVINGEDFDTIISGINWGAIAAFAFLAIVSYLIAYGISLGMACDAVETGTATIGGGFSRCFSRIGHLILAGILVSIIVVVGLVLCLLPGIAAAFLLMFTFIGIVYSGRSAMEGISGSFEMVKSNIPDALIFLLIGFGISFSASLITNILDIMPVVGSLIGAVIQAAFTVFSTVLFVKVYAGLLELETEPEAVI